MAETGSAVGASGPASNQGKVVPSLESIANNFSNLRNFANSRGKRPIQNFSNFRTFHRRVRGSVTQSNTSISEVSDISQDTPSVDSNSQRPKKQRVCKYFKADGSCFYGDKCRFLHHTANKENFPSKVVNKMLKDQTAVKKNIVRPARTILHGDQIGADEQKQCRRAEINYFKRRFPQVKIDNLNGTTRIEFVFKVQDPEWVFEVQHVTFVFTLPEDYPLESPKLDILQERLPKPLHVYLIKKFSEIIEAKFLENAANDSFENMGKWFIQQINKNILELFTVGLKRTKWLLDAEMAGIKVVLPENSPKSEKTVKDTTKVKENIPIDENVLYEEEEPESHEVSDDESVEGQQENLTDLPPVPSTAENSFSEPSALIDVRVNWTDLSRNIATLTLTFISLSIRCLRCSGAEITECLNGKTQNDICKRCSTGQSVKFDSILAHQNSNLVGKVLPKGCKPADCVLLNSKLRFACLTCNKECDVQALSYGTPYKSWCFNCHTRCEFIINSISFAGNFAQIAQEDPSVPRERKSKKVDAPLIIVGQPLPKQGTCKHFTKSYRWFRFPCCGKLYPCDQCHNETELDHDMTYSNRMVCGFCSKEQPFGQSCTNCTGFVTRLRTSHWEGGKGCRNKGIMSRTDDRKYKNSSQKTVPTKRTGQEGKSKCVKNKVN